jgi:hypothetical protein
MMISFRTKAEGGSHVGDRIEIRRALSLLISPGDRHELRALPSGACRIVSGDDLDTAVEAAMELADQQVYYSLNPIKPDAARANKKTVLRRCWLLIDLDPIRPKDTSSTDAEKANAYDVAAAIVGYLIDQSWPAPLIIDSGNGWHLIYRVELPNDQLSHQLVKAMLYELGQRFDTPETVIDRATHDAPRISKLPGTLARKGVSTPERPHRMARIAYEPDRLDVVSLEQLRAIGTPPATQTNGTHTHSGFNTTAQNGTGKSAWIQSAIERECYRVLIAPQGSRNVALNVAAFKLGQLAGWPEMRSGEAIAALKQAGDRAGLTAHEIEHTVMSGWQAGEQAPRERPIKPGTNKPATTLAKLTIGLYEITPKKVDWLWENIAAPGFISIFAGRTGVGKSFVTCDFAARLSRGESPAFSSLKRSPCRTLFISEDPPEYMLGPRLLEMKASQQMIRFMTFEAMAQFRLDRLDVLEAAYLECGRPQVIVIDPPSNFLGKTDDHKNSELRGVLMGVVEWINRHNVACIMITHLNKAIGKGLDAVSRVIGSVAWVSTARITVLFEQEPDTPGRFVMGGGKNNLGQKAGTLAYEIEQTSDLAIVKWIGPVDTTADDAVNGVKKNRGQRATEWLEERFQERQSWPAEELYALGRSDGVSRSAIWDVVGNLPIQKRQETPADGKPRFWEWSAIPPWPAEKTLKRCEILKSCPDKASQDTDLHSVSSSDIERNPETEGRISEFQNFRVSEEENTETLRFPKPEGYPDDWTYFSGEEKKETPF